MMSSSVIDIGIAGFIVAFSSSVTYGVIYWFRQNKKK